jgi:hypothetical protein
MLMSAIARWSPKALVKLVTSSTVYLKHRAPCWL